MSTYGVSQVEGGNLVANVDLSASQFQAVKQSATDRQIVLASTGGEAITGILNNTPKLGEAAEVAFSGFTKAKAGAGGWVAGNLLMTEATTGNLIVKTGSNAVVAVGIEAAAAGSIALVRIVPTAG